MEIISIDSIKNEEARSRFDHIIKYENKKILKKEIIGNLVSGIVVYIFFSIFYNYTTIYSDYWKSFLKIELSAVTIISSMAGTIIRKHNDDKIYKIHIQQYQWNKILEIFLEKSKYCLCEKYNNIYILMRKSYFNNYRIIMIYEDNECIYILAREKYINQIEALMKAENE